MKKMQGFTLIEFIITIVLSAILSAIVIEIVAGPIRSYFWVSQQSSLFEIGTQVMGSLAQELPRSSAKDLKIESRTIDYRKILYTGLMLTRSQSTITLAGTLAHFDDDQKMEEKYFVLFPSDPLATLYPVNNIAENKIELENTISEAINKNNILFYLVSLPLRIEFNPSTKILTRIVSDKNGKTIHSILGNQIEDCQFAASDQNKKSVRVTLSFKNDKQSIKMINEFVIEEAL